MLIITCNPAFITGKCNYGIQVFVGQQELICGASTEANKSISCNCRCYTHPALENFIAPFAYNLHALSLGERSPRSAHN